MIKEAFFYFYFLTPNNKVSRKRILYRQSDLILVVVGGLWVVLEYMNENVSFHQKEKNTSKTQSLKPKLISTPQRAIS